jgi:hypothetical protein
MLCLSLLSKINNKMKKQIVNFSTILLLLFSILVTSCKVDEPNPTDIRMDVYPNPNNGSIRINVNNNSNQSYQLIIFDPEGNKIYEKSGDKKSQIEYAFNLKEKEDRTGIFYAILKTPTSTIKTRIFVV